jgi:hypothetical protein
MKKPEDIFPDFTGWPERWRGSKRDVPYGEGLLDVMRSFILQLISKGLKKKTIRIHMDNLWLLGGEVIRDVYENDQYDVPPLKKLRESVDSSGGPYCRHIDSEPAMNSFDATCRKLHKFLETK